MNHFKHSFSTIFVTSLVTLNIVFFSSASSVSIQDLGHFSGQAVSDDGSTVIGIGTANIAVRWHNGTLQQLDNLPGHTSSWAADVSSDGSVVVGTSDDTVNEIASGFRWENGAVTNLGYFNQSTKYTKGMGVSADGSIAVGDSISTWDNQAYKWTLSGGMQGLGYLPGQYTSYATTISKNGSIIAGYGSSSSGPVAIMWKNNSKISLGDLPGGAYESIAFGVSNNEMVVGRSESANGTEAFCWTVGTGMVGLGDLSGGMFYSTANALSEDGSVIVGMSNSSEGYEAMIWDEINGMRSLKSVLETDFSLDMSLWRLSEAMDITPDGLTIIGKGYYNNQSGHTWMVTIPEPMILTFMSAGIILLRKRKNWK